MRPLPPEFYARDTLTVARALLGKHLAARRGGDLLVARIVEVEAYCGRADAASHAHRAPPDGRVRVMYGEPGHFYIYFIYGNHFCLNVVTRPPGQPEGVLIRAAEPVEGIGAMRALRGGPKVPDCKLLSGPGNLCRGLGIDGALYGAPCWGEEVFVAEGDRVGPGDIIATPRIGIGARAGEAASYPYRFVIPSPAVSGKKVIQQETGRL